MGPYTLCTTFQFEQNYYRNQDKVAFVVQFRDL